MATLTPEAQQIFGTTFDPPEHLWILKSANPRLHIVLDIFLAGPHHLHGAVNMFSDLDSTNDANGRPAVFAAAAWAHARTWLPTQTSQSSLRTWTVQFVGSIVACARNGTW